MEIGDKNGRNVQASSMKLIVLFIIWRIVLEKMQSVVFSLVVGGVFDTLTLSRGRVNEKALNIFNKVIPGYFFISNQNCHF